MKLKKQKGGHRLNIIEGIVETEEQAYTYFIHNSTCKIISYTSVGGIIFKLTLNPGVASPYSTIRSIGTGMVTEVILKICFINNIKGSKVEFITTHIKYLSSLDIDDFQSEINIQNEIYSSSFDAYLEPICPAITYANIYDDYSILHILIARASDEETKTIIRSTHIRLLNNFIIGTIMMESLTGFETIHNTITKHDPSIYEIHYYHNLALFELWRLFQLGILHGDPHLSNLMINTTYPYIQGRPGRVIIIDFGARIILNEKLISKYKIQPANNNNITEVALLSRTITSPTWLKHGFPETLARTHSAHRWLDRYYADPTSRMQLNVVLKGIYDAREKSKHNYMLAAFSSEDGSIQLGSKVIGVSNSDSHRIPSISEAMVLGKDTETKTAKKQEHNSGALSINRRKESKFRSNPSSSKWTTSIQPTNFSIWRSYHNDIDEDGVDMNGDDVVDDGAGDVVVDDGAGADDRSGFAKLFQWKPSELNFPSVSAASHTDNFGLMNSASNYANGNDTGVASAMDNNGAASMDDNSATILLPPPRPQPRPQPVKLKINDIVKLNDVPPPEIAIKNEFIIIKIIKEDGVMYAYIVPVEDQHARELSVPISYLTKKNKRGGKTKSKKRRKDGNKTISKKNFYKKM